MSDWQNPKRAASGLSLIGLAGCAPRMMWSFVGGMGCMLFIALGLLGLGLATGLGINGILSSIAQAIGGNAPTTMTSVFVPVVDPFTRLSNLTTMRYNYANIVEMKTDMPALLQTLYGNRQVMVAVGHVQAGIDMRQITQDDLRYDAQTRTLTLRLPAPALQACYIDEQKTYIAEQSSGVFAPKQPRVDRESRLYALRQFRDKALEDGILADAQAEAALIVREFAQFLLDSSGTGGTVIIENAPINPNAPLPESCR